MNKPVYLISPIDVISGSLIDDNVDANVLGKAILIAQENGLKPILGKGLYNEVIQAVYADIFSGTPITDVYTSLLDYSRSYLIAQVAHDLITLNGYRLGGKGLTKAADDSLTEISDTELINVQNYYNNLITTHKRDLIQFLSVNHLLSGFTDTNTTSSVAGGWFKGLGIHKPKLHIEQEAVLSAITYDANVIDYQQLKIVRNTLLVRPEDVIAESIIDDNADEKVLANTIAQVQDVYLRPILTDAVYNELLYGFNQSIVSGGTLNAIYSDLLTLVKPYVINKVVAESIISFTYRFSNKGIIKNSDTISDTDIRNLKYYYENICTGYKSQLIDFMNKYNLTNCSADRNITSEITGWFKGLGVHKHKPVQDNLALSSLAELVSDTYITGATFNSNILSLVNNSGDTISVNLSGLSTTDTYLADAHISNDSLFLALNIGDVYEVPLTAYSKTDTYTTGGTYTDGALSLIDNSGNAVSINGFLTGDYLPITGGTLTGIDSNNYAQLLTPYYDFSNRIGIALSDFNTGNLYGSAEIDFDIVDGLLIENRNPDNGTYSSIVSNKETVYLSQGDNVNYNANLRLGSNGNNFGLLSLEDANLSIYSLAGSGNRFVTVDVNGLISATTLSLSDTYTTGGTFNNASGVISLVNNTGGTFNVSGLTNPYILNLPTTTGSTYGVISQNNIPVFQTYGTNNLFFGANAGNFTLTTATGRNIAIGVSALTNDTTGNNNTAIGYQSLVNNNVGNQNVALGNQALFSLSTVSNGNTAIGYQTLFSFSGYPSTADTTQRLPNTAVGGLVLANNTSGYGNTGLGYASLFQNITGGNNAAFGYWSMRFNTTGNENTAFGTTALRENTTGNGNVALGRTALRSNTTGSTNVAIGFEAGFTTSGDSNIFIGKQAGFSETGSNKLYIANSNTTTPLIGGDFSTGYLGINTNAPTNALHVIGSSNPLRLQGLQSASDTTVLTVDASGVVTTRLVSSIGGSATTITDYVTTGTTQVITGAKTFSANTTFGNSIYDVTNNRLGISVTPTSKLHIRTNGIGVTQNNANGILVENITPATSALTQTSPPIILAGTGWATTPSASQDIKVKIDILPIQNSGAVYPSFRVQKSVTGGSYTDLFSVYNPATSNDTVFTLAGSKVVGFGGGVAQYYAGSNGYTFYDQAGAVTLMGVSSAGKISLLATNTASGTTGNQTINRPTGTVNIAAGGTSITVTNNTVASTSLVFATIRTNDSTAQVKNVLPSAGSFVINLVSAATAETSIGFFVIN